MTIDPTALPPPPPPPPPPPQPPPPAARSRDSNLRTAGLLVACSTPVSGFLSYAVASILFGETALENADGLTPAGIVVMLLPLLLGLAIVIWSFSSFEGPGVRPVATVGALAGVAMVGLGLFSTMTSDGDASIGGGILVLAGPVVTVLSGLALRADSARR